MCAKTESCSSAHIVCFGVYYAFWHAFWMCFTVISQYLVTGRGYGWCSCVYENDRGHYIFLEIFVKMLLCQIVTGLSTAKSIGYLASSPLLPQALTPHQTQGQPSAQDYYQLDYCIIITFKLLCSAIVVKSLCSCYCAQVSMVKLLKS